VVGGLALQALGLRAVRVGALEALFGLLRGLAGPRGVGLELLAVARASVLRRSRARSRVRCGAAPRRGRRACRDGDDGDDDNDDDGGHGEDLPGCGGARSRW
jgi:hypothetical protein